MLWLCNFCAALQFDKTIVCIGITRDIGRRKIVSDLFLVYCNFIKLVSFDKTNLVSCDKFLSIYGDQQLGKPKKFPCILFYLQVKVLFWACELEINPSMGNLLKILSSKETNRDDFYHVFVDFESKFY